MTCLLSCASMVPVKYAMIGYPSNKFSGSTPLWTSKHHQPALLPFELERYIFQISARQHITNAVCLALVARRVQAWVEPIIYETVVLCHPFQPGRSYHWALRRTRSFLRTMTLSERARHLARHIKNLFLDITISPQIAEHILLLSTNLVSVAYWVTGNFGADPVPGSFLSLIRSYQLSCLSINTRYVYNTWANVDLSNPIFANLSHLDIVNDREPLWDLPELQLLPSLTHLAVDAGTGANWLRRTLWVCKALRVLVLRISGLVDGDAVAVNDSRIVMMESYYWSGCNLTLWDIWARAESILIQRAADPVPGA